MAGFTQDIGARVTVTVARVAKTQPAKCLRIALSISSSIRMLDSFAPPCIGPHSDASPAATQANKFAPEEPAARTVVVEAHCP